MTPIGQDAGTIGLALVLAVTMLLGCRERPACSPEALAGIESRYVIEVLQVCRGKTRETCDGLAAIESRYRAERESWIRCR